MQYIRLDNDSYIVNLSIGLTTITRKSFNYNKIKRLIDKNSAEEDILPLLIPPKLVNGVYEAYLNPEKDILYYVLCNNGNTQNAKTMDNSQYKVAHPVNDILLGVYASIEDILQDWPEYAI